MSMVIIPHMSWTILLVTTVDPTTWGWACFWGYIDGYAGAIISMQGLGNFGKTGKWHLPPCDGAARQCLHPLGEDIWHTSPLA